MLRSAASAGWARRELLLVVAAVAFGLAVDGPCRLAVRHDGIDVALAVLVLLTGLTVAPSALGSLARSPGRALAAVAVWAVLLPVLAWATALLVQPGATRDGVLAVGVAPCEVASVGVAAIAGADVALAAGLLLASTLTTVLLAGAVLGLETAHASVNAPRLVVDLALVVALPLATGIAARARFPDLARQERTAREGAALAVGCLVALTASEVQGTASYLPVVGALLLFVVGSAALGVLLGLGASREDRVSLLFTTSMRDFAVAAALATSAFGAAAAGPLAVYGVVVLVAGTAVAGRARRRAAR